MQEYIWNDMAEVSLLLQYVVGTTLILHKHPRLKVHSDHFFKTKMSIFGKFWRRKPKCLYMVSFELRAATLLIKTEFANDFNYSNQKFHEHHWWLMHIQIAFHAKRVNFFRG